MVSVHLPYPNHWCWVPGLCWCMMAKLGWNGEECWDREGIKGSGTLTEMAPQGLGAGFLEAGALQLVLRTVAVSI